MLNKARCKYAACVYCPIGVVLNDSRDMELSDVVSDVRFFFIIKYVFWLKNFPGVG